MGLASGLTSGFTSGNLSADVGGRDNSRGGDEFKTTSSEKESSSITSLNSAGTACAAHTPATALSIFYTTRTFLGNSLEHTHTGDSRHSNRVGMPRLQPNTLARFSRISTPRIHRFVGVAHRVAPLNYRGIGGRIIETRVNVAWAITSLQLIVFHNANAHRPQITPIQYRLC